jgi:hypothetical protein
MNKEEATPRSVPIAVASSGDPSKLLSLLALAAGAASIPQTSNADIIVTDLSVPVTVVGNTNSSFLIDNLPGISGGRAVFGFQGDARTARPATSHSVRVSQKQGYVRLATDKGGFVLPVGTGKKWSTIVGAGLPSTHLPGVQSNKGYAAMANQNTHNPVSFDHQYMLFKFKDNSLPPTDNVRYGWLDFSVANANGIPPTVTIFRYAYDDTGAFIVTGMVPEPAPLSLLALGALALGAKGLRSWRRNRTAEPQS